MEFFLPDPNVRRVPPVDTRLVDLHAEVYPDGKRLRVVLNITPFEQKPYIDLNFADSRGTVLATASIVEPATFKLELTLHIRKGLGTLTGPYALAASLYYPEIGEVDHRRLLIELPTPTQ